jgi:hypothetical protein
MIEILPSTAAVLYLGATLFTILGIWFYSHYSAKRKERVPLIKKLTVCEFCHFAYLDSSEKGVTKCPQCSSFNKGT